MGQKKSSFNIGGEFNGNGQKVYLSGTQRKTHTSIPRRNVRLTPDFSACLLKVLGAVPLVLNPSAPGTGSILKALGGLPGVGRIIVKKDAAAGKYQMGFTVDKNQLTTGSYLHTSQSSSKDSKTEEQFIMETASRFIK